MITCQFEKGYNAHLRHVVVHALVERDRTLLLVKRAGDLLESGKWGLPGGFLSRDETGPEGALRELYEETGWEGKIITLFRINTNPRRPHEDRQNVVLEYLVESIRQSGTMDNESSEIMWVPFDRLLPPDQYAFDHGESITLLKTHIITPFSLPIVE